MAYEYKITRRVEWADTDMAGIMHFSNFFRFMEAAEHAFFRSIGESIDTDTGSRRFGWPRVHSNCDFLKPARFEDEIQVHLLVREISEKTILHNFILRNLATDTLIARGAIRVACVDHNRAAGTMTAVPIPKTILQKIEPVPKTILNALEL